MRARSQAIALALIGLAFAAYVEYGTTRGADVERSFGLVVFEAGPWVLLLFLALLSPFARTLAAVAIVLLALGVYAYFAVFVATSAPTSAVIYLYKPFYGLVLVAAGVLAGFPVARTNAPKA
jgi:hypothetical protein